MHIYIYFAKVGLDSRRTGEVNTLSADAPCSALRSLWLNQLAGRVDFGSKQHPPVRQVCHVRCIRPGPGWCLAKQRRGFARSGFAPLEGCRSCGLPTSCTKPREILQTTKHQTSLVCEKIRSKGAPCRGFSGGRELPASEARARGTCLGVWLSI